MGVGEARGKLLLFGEHAAVYGFPAVGCALPWSLRATLTPGERWTLPGLGPHEASVAALLDRLTDLAHQEGLPLPTPGCLEIRTTIPLAGGFGSSGALCAGLVNVFWGDRALADRDRWAWEAEGLFHGTPSGIDTALALRQGWWALDTSTRPVTATPLPRPEFTLIVGALVRETDTKTLVQDLAQRRQRQPEVVQALERLGTVAARAVDTLRTGGDWVALVREARTHLQALGLETSEMRDILDLGLSCPGALAGKLSGAGGGGAFFLVFEDEESAHRAVHRMGDTAPGHSWLVEPQVLAI